MLIYSPLITVILFTILPIISGQFLDVYTNRGLVRGRTLLSENGREYYSFTGIPYALPPINELRFSKPREHPGWPAVFEALQYRQGCVQLDATGSPVGTEDCLYLNVFTPFIESRNRPDHRKLPVMVYFHAESFENGDSSLYGAQKLMDKDIVLVTFNYRLGIFGFLSTEDDAATGNWGLYDQKLVLDWIHLNIENFGGDKMSVTLFGQGAGAASVFFHLISPLSQSLFHKAILQSGSGLCDWSLERHALEYAKSVGEAVGCTYTTSEDLVLCLRQKPAYLLLQIQRFGKIFGEFPQRAVPVIERTGNDQFIPDEPRLLLQRNNYEKIPVMMGVNNDETSYFYPVIVRAFDQGSDKYIEKLLVSPFLEALTPYQGNMKDYVLGPIMNSYFNDIDATNLTQVGPRFVNMTKDASYLSCVDESLKLLWTTGSPVYMYVFDYKGTNTMVQTTYDNRPRRFETGVCHGDELFYLFTLRDVQMRLPSFRDKIISQRLLTLWTDFAKYGYAPKLENYEYPKWNPFHPETLAYYEIGTDLIQRFNYRQEEAKFWSLFLRNITGTLPTALAQIQLATQPMYQALAWSMIAVSLALLTFVIILLTVLYFQRRSQSFRAHTPEGTASHLSSRSMNLY